jgi:hypothetical protein
VLLAGACGNDATEPGSSATPAGEAAAATTEDLRDEVLVDLDDPAFRVRLDELEARFELPPDGEFAYDDRPHLEELLGLLQSMAFQAMCEWFRFLVPAVKAGRADEVDRSVRALSVIASGPYSNGIIDDIVTEVLEDTDGLRTAAAERELRINC